MIYRWCKTLEMSSQVLSTDTLLWYAGDAKHWRCPLIGGDTGNNAVWHFPLLPSNQIDPIRNTNIRRWWQKQMWMVMAMSTMKNLCWCSSRGWIYIWQICMCLLFKNIFSSYLPWPIEPWSYAHCFHKFRKHGSCVKIGKLTLCSSFHWI